MCLLGVTSLYVLTVARMSISSIATWTIVAGWLAAVSAIRCPQMCTCSLVGAYPSASLTVSCSSYQNNEQQIDTLLSENKLGENLKSLDLSNTMVMQVPSSVCPLSNLELLKLDYNRLTRFPDYCFTNMTSLKHLTIYKNQITRLQDGSLDGLKSLNLLNLGWNLISDVGLHVFSNRSNLRNLRDIRLDRNVLTSLEPWPYIRGLHGSYDSKVSVELSYNYISNFTNEIGWKLNCSEHSYVVVNLSTNRMRHLTDVAIGWNITPLARVLCIFRISFHHEILLAKVNFQDQSQYICDCQDFAVYKFQRLLSSLRSRKPNTILDGLKCSAPFHLAGTPVLQVQLEEFECELKDSCVSNCHCAYRPANGTLHVYCSTSNLSSLPIDVPLLPRSYAKYKLDFSNNKLLRYLDHRFYFVNTSILDVSKCALVYIGLNIWQTLLTRIPSIYLHGNKMSYFPREIAQINVTSTHLSLYGNPWQCSCSNQWMIAWLKSLSSALTNGANIICAAPSRLVSRSILRSSEDDFCVDPAMRMLKISLSASLSAVAALLLFGFSVYRLRVRVYRRWKFHPFDRDECVGEDMDYDVFLCCSSEDDNPHALRVLQLMEEHGYRVCYHERDFLPGELIADNMTHGVVRSKRTVCLISENFLRR